MVYHPQSHKLASYFLAFRAPISTQTDKKPVLDGYLAWDLALKSIQSSPFPKTEFFVRNIGSYPVCTL